MDSGIRSGNDFGPAKTDVTTHAADRSEGPRPCYGQNGGAEMETIANVLFGYCKFRSVWTAYLDRSSGYAAVDAAKIGPRDDLSVILPSCLRHSARL